MFLLYYIWYITIKHNNWMPTRTKGPPNPLLCIPVCDVEPSNISAWGVKVGAWLDVTILPLYESKVKNHYIWISTKYNIWDGARCMILVVEVFKTVLVVILLNFLFWITHGWFYVKKFLSNFIYWVDTPSFKCSINFII